MEDNNLVFPCTIKTVCWLGAALCLRGNYEGKWSKLIRLVVVVYIQTVCGLWIVLYLSLCSTAFPSVLWCCWLGGRKGIRPVKKWVVGYWHGYLEWGADLYMAQQIPLLLTVSCFSKIRIDFTFLVLAYPRSPGQRAIKRVCVQCCLFWALAYTLCLIKRYPTTNVWDLFMRHSVLAGIFYLK